MVELRCPCHRLLMKMSSTSSYRLETMCPRCKTLRSFASTGEPVQTIKLALDGKLVTAVVR